MESKVWFQLIIYTAPIFSSLVCCLLLILCYQDRARAVRSQILRLLIFYYATVVINWTGSLIYIYKPTLFVYINSILYLSLLWALVTFYHFVCLITDTGTGKRFSIIHYIIPLVLCLTLAVWSFYVPFDVQTYIVESRGDYVESYKWYSILFTSKLPVRLVYNIIYFALGIYQLYCYRRRIIDYSADEKRTSMHWLYLILALSLTMAILPLASLFVSKANLINSFISGIPVLLIIINHVILCYNVIRGNYVIVSSPDKDEVIEYRRVYSKHNLTVEAFDRYMRENKPYLDSGLKITDLTLHFHTNRTYLSSFINNNYGMNFCRYINSLRMREFEQLRKNPDFIHYKDQELILIAGFSNYRAYFREKRIGEDKLKHKASSLELKD